MAAGDCPKCGQDASPYDDHSFFPDGISLTYSCQCGTVFIEQYAFVSSEVVDEDLDEERQDDEAPR